jgi:hypothetical protein
MLRPISDKAPATVCLYLRDDSMVVAEVIDSSASEADIDTYLQDQIGRWATVQLVGVYHQHKKSSKKSDTSKKPDTSIVE